MTPDKYERFADDAFCVKLRQNSKPTKDNKTSQEVQLYNHTNIITKYRIAC